MDESDGNRDLANGGVNISHDSTPVLINPDEDLENPSVENLESPDNTLDDSMETLESPDVTLDDSAETLEIPEEILEIPVANGTVTAHNGIPPGAEVAEDSEDLKIKVQRPVYTQPEFDEECKPALRKTKTIKERFKSKTTKCTCSPSCVRKWCLHKLPFIGIMSAYNPKSDFLDDLIAGLTVGVMQIPQGTLKVLYILVSRLYVHGIIC